MNVLNIFCNLAFQVYTLKICFMLQLNLNSAPAFMHFPAKGKRKSADTYEIQRQGFQADNVAKWVAERTEIAVRILRSVFYLRTLFVAVSK